MLKLLKRFFEIDFDLLYVQNISIIQRFSYICSIYPQLVFNFFTKKNIYRIFGKRLLSDKLLTIKTFISTIYDVYWETVWLSIFDKKNPTIVDIWANIWQFAFACKYLLPESNVISFEPNPSIFKILQENLNQYPNCELYNIWLADKDSILDFHLSDVSSEWCSFVKPSEWNYEIIQVKAKRWDDVLKNLKEIDLMKVDVEWFEKLVLLWCEWILNNVKYLIIESSIGRTSSDLWSSDLLTYIMSKWFVVHNIGRIYGDWFAKNQWAVDITFRNNSLFEK